MGNFSPKLEDATDEQLMHMVNELDFRVVPLASDELTRRTIGKLEKMLEVFNSQSSKQTEKMIRLTWGIIALTIILVVGLGIQIYLAKIQVSPILFEWQRNERRAFEFCKTTANPDIESWSSAIGGEIKCNDVLKMLQDKF